MSTSTASEPIDTTVPQPQVKLNRTCSNCRERKIKCVPLPETATSTCTRCCKMSLDCVFAPSARQRPRKRNERRIRDLEARLAAVQAAVFAGSAPPTALPAQRRCDDTASLPPSQLASDIEPCSAVTTPATSLSKASRTGVPPTHDTLDPCVIEELFSAFCNSLAPLYPLVLVPGTTKWQTLRHDRPALFKAILTAASSSLYPSLCSRLFEDTAKYLAEKIVIAGEKSLDLIQALLIMSTWHLPSDTFGELKFSQYAHMAATMVQDLRSSNDERFMIPSPHNTVAHSEEQLEVCRTFIASYLLCSSMALSFRRSNVLPYGPWLDSSVEYLEASVGLHLNDQRLVAWVKLQRIAEESLQVVGLNCDSAADIYDLRTRFILNSCVERVTSWRRTMSHDLINQMKGITKSFPETLEMHYQMILVTLNEPALYKGNNMADFRPPYLLRHVSPSKVIIYPSTKDIASSLSQCQVAAKSLIHTLVDTDDSILLSMPVVSYTRMAYAVIVLIKCYTSALAHAGAACASHEQSLDPMDTIYRLLTKLDSVMSQRLGLVRVTAIFHSFLLIISDWCTEQLVLGHSDDDDSAIEPLKYECLNRGNCQPIDAEIGAVCTWSGSAEEDSLLPLLVQDAPPWDLSAILGSGYFDSFDLTGYVTAEQMEVV